MKNEDDVVSISPAVEPLNFQEGWPCFREHSLFEAAVTEASRELQVSREMAMMCAFGAMATACQGYVDVLMPTGHKVPTSLMLLTIADSGERKTTTQNYFFGTINALNDVAHRQNEADMAEHRVVHRLWYTDMRHLEREYVTFRRQDDKAKAKKARKAYEAHVRAEPRPPRSGKFLYEDTTPQALVLMLYENMPNACMLTSEANSIFSGKALGELDKLNTLWDGSSVIVDRISREGFTLQNARLTLALMAQPSVISRFMGRRGEEARGSGFLARFLVAKPRPMAGFRESRTVFELPRQQAFNARLRERLETGVPEKRHILRFSEAAAALWYEYSQYLEAQMRENGLYHYAKDHASKLLENVSRLAAILHAFEYGIDSDREIDAFTLTFCWTFARICSQHFTEYLANEPQLVADANLLAHFLLRIAVNEYRNSEEAQDKKKTKQKEALRDNRPLPYEPLPNHLRHGIGTDFTLTTIKQRGPTCFRGRANAERLEATIELLTKLGHIKKEGSFYRFGEALLLRSGEPQLKNGEIVTIKELPLFREQEYWIPERRHGLTNSPHYAIRID